MYLSVNGCRPSAVGEGGPQGLDTNQRRGSVWLRRCVVVVSPLRAVDVEVPLPTRNLRGRRTNRRLALSGFNAIHRAAMQAIGWGNNLDGPRIPRSAASGEPATAQRSIGHESGVPWRLPSRIGSDRLNWVRLAWGHLA